MFRNQEGKINGNFGRPITYDVTFPETNNPAPAVIFAHGFKGFKDWGEFGLVANAFAGSGFVFLKFNFAFNGTTPESLEDFSDLEAFSENNFTRELNDLQQVLDLLIEKKKDWNIDEERIFVVGHSRGGGISIIFAAGNEKVSGVAAWASVADFGKFLSMANVELWRTSDLIYIPNSRTGQQMPLRYQLYEDFIRNSEALNVESAASLLAHRLLLVHGTHDETVPIDDTEMLAKRTAGSVFVPIHGANHTFGGSHPVRSNVLPAHMALVVQKTIDFFRSVSVF